MMRLSRRTLLVAIVTAAIGAADAVREPVVSTKHGQLSGTVIKSFVGNRIFAFKGIPYAEPPVGELRFRTPRPHPGWTGVRKAKVQGNKCPQTDIVNPAKIAGAEDCLFLNVYTPRLASAAAPANLPVMVWIHGGGFVTGDSSTDFYGPGYIMDQQVVLVTINYRLNVFGFLTTGDAAASGNYGLHDQALALQWVKENIAAFGGDPQSVTIFGESAGGASIGLQVLSPRASGLFSRAISQSGASFCNFAARGVPQGEMAKQHAELLGCDVSSNQAIVDCMRKQPAMKLMETLLEISPKVPFPIVYKPRVDAEAETPFLPEDPYTRLQEGRFNRVPWMSGFNSGEGALPVTLIRNMGMGDLLMEKDWDAWSKTLLEIDDVMDNPAAAAEQIYRFYFGDGAASEDNYPRLADIFTDRMFSTCVTTEIELASAHTTVYQYLLDHTGPGRQNMADAFNRLSGKAKGPEMGVSHADDLLYLFQPVFAFPVLPDSVEHKMVRFIVSVWVNFAQYGVPATDVVAMPSWPVYTAEGRHHMRLNLSPSVGEDAFGDRVKFWQQSNIRENWRMPLVGHDKDEL